MNDIQMMELVECTSLATPNMKLALNNNCVDYCLGNSENSTTTTQLVHGETKHTPKCIYKSKKVVIPSKFAVHMAIPRDNKYRYHIIQHV